MRLALVVVAVGCSGAPARPPPPPAPPPPTHHWQPLATVAKRYRVAVLGIEYLGTLDPTTTSDVRRFTEYLRSIARDDPSGHLASSRHELIDEKMLHDCGDEAAACMAGIGKALDADVVIYGHLNPGPLGYAVDLHGLHVETQIVHSWSGKATSAEPDLRLAARTGYAAIVGRVE